MNKSELAQMMLEYEDLISRANSIADVITSQVLEMGQTFTVGNVVATYSKGRRKLDYEAACKTQMRWGDEVDNFTEEIPEEIIPAYTKTDWIGLAKLLGVDPVVLAQAPPSVKIKIKKDG